jgi:hypothetical protein
VLYLELSDLMLPGEGNTASGFTGDLRSELILLLNTFVGQPPPQQTPGSGGPVRQGLPGAGAAQTAIALALAENADLLPTGLLHLPGSSPIAGRASNGSPVNLLPQRGSGTASGSSPAEAQAAAVTRFLALPASARHAWLLSHLAALRAGHITLNEVP